MRTHTLSISEFSKTSRKPHECESFELEASAAQAQRTLQGIRRADPDELVSEEDLGTESGLLACTRLHTCGGTSE